MKHKIPLSQPDITNLERKEISQVLKTPYLSLGPKVKEFEAKIANYLEIKYAIAVNSGTSALHLAIRALNVNKGDEVITAPFSFISSANCILYERAKPVFVDINPQTLCIDTNKIEGAITRKTKAILAIDIFGHPANWPQLKKIAQKHNLYLIEDAAEAFGSESKGKKCGTFADISIFSFYPNKQITTGEGGMIMTNNAKIAEICQSLRNQGRDLIKEEWNRLLHPRVGYNYKMPEICAAMGVAQFKRIREIITRRENVAKLYNQKLKNISEIELPYMSPEVKMSWFVYVIRLKKDCEKKKRDKILLSLKKEGIGCSNYFPSIHLQPPYKKMFGYKTGDFPTSENVSRRTIALPFYNNLPEKDIDYVIKALKKNLI